MASSSSLSSPITRTDSPTSSTETPVTGSPQSRTDTSTLYLVTFLATILVLLILSGSLLVRSYILRRRYRARLQQAIADGLFVDLDPTAFNGPGLFTPVPFAGPLRRPTRRLGAKPVLWEMYLIPKETECSNAHFWSSITPIALRLTCPLPTSESPSTSPDTPSSPQQRPSIFSYLHLPRSVSPFSPRSPGPPTPSQSQSPIGPSQTNLVGTRSPPQDSTASPNVSSSTDEDSGSVSVCVLISMPDAHAPRSSPVSDDKGKGVVAFDSHTHQQSTDMSPAPGPSSQTWPDEGAFPLVEFGIVEMKATVLGDIPRGGRHGE